MAHKFSERTFRDALNADAIRDVEQIAGKRWNDWNQDEQMLALRLHAGHVEARRRALESRDDVYFSIKLPEFERIIADIGFRKIYCLEFQDFREPRQEAMKCWWLDEHGILLKYDTYFGQQSVNSGHFFYNWKMHEGTSWETRCDCVSSSSPCGDGVIAGSHDCREAVRYHIGQLLTHGLFVVPWKSAACAYLSLRHYRDFRESEDDKLPLQGRLRRRYEIDLQRLSEFPDEVVRATGWRQHIEERLTRME